MIREFNGNTPRIAESAFVSEAAYVAGDVEIGSFRIIGAGCLVMQGMKIPDNSFVVGSPGKIKGQPTKQRLWWVQEGLEGYSELARNYKKQGL